MLYNPIMRNEHEEYKGNRPGLPLLYNSIAKIKKAYFEGNLSDADVSVFLEKFFGYSLEEAQKATFKWRYRP